MERKPHYEMAPAENLVLHACDFNHLAFNFQPEVLWRLCHEFEAQWELAQLKASRLRSALDYLYSRTVRREDVDQLRVDQKRAFGHLGSGKSDAGSGGEADAGGGGEHGSEVGGGAPADVGKAGSDAVCWYEAMEQLGGVDNAPGTQRNYTPLMQRPGGSTLEEKVGALGAKHKQKRKQIDDKRAVAAESDDAFFKRKRSQGAGTI